MILTPEELTAVCAQAEREYPRECCGVVMVRSGERRILAFRNVQDEMHRKDPARFPRTAERAYYVGRDDQERMFELMDKGFELAVIYHSHPDAGAYFSETDARQAAPPEAPGPLWPGTTYVVVSVRGDRADEWAAFRWEPQTATFIEVHRAPVPGGPRPS